MLYEAADGFLSGEKTGGIISLLHTEKVKNTRNTALFYARKETVLLEQA